MINFPSTVQKHSDKDSASIIASGHLKHKHSMYESQNQVFRTSKGLHRQKASKIRTVNL